MVFRAPGSKGRQRQLRQSFFGRSAPPPCDRMSLGRHLAFLLRAHLGPEDDRMRHMPRDAKACIAMYAIAAFVMLGWLAGAFI